MFVDVCFPERCIVGSAVEMCSTPKVQVLALHKIDKVRPCGKSVKELKNLYLSYIIL